MTETDIFKRIAQRIDSMTDDMIQLQYDLTAIPALAPESGGDGEEKKARYLKNFLKSSGFEDIRLYNAPDKRTSSGIRPNVVATIQGENPHRKIWIVTHTDVVPPGEPSFWERDPYEAYMKDSKIFGRGTEDNQQDLVASIFAAKAFLEEGIMPKSTIRLAFVADEETGSQYGLGYLLDKEQQLFGKDDLIVVPDFGSDSGTAIEIAEKSILWLRFKTVGKQCHASVPSLGNNAFVASSYLVVKLRDLYSRFDSIDSLYDPPESTFEPTKKEANVPNINTIPGEDIFYLDCRVLPQYELSLILRDIGEITKEIESQWNVSIEVSPVQKVQAPSPTSDTAPVVGALKEAIRETYGIAAKSVGIGGGTVAALLRQKGYPVACWSILDRMAHQPNEYCKISNMVGNAKVFAHLFLQNSSS